MKLYNIHNLFTEEERKLWTNLELYTSTFEDMIKEVHSISTAVDDNDIKVRLSNLVDELGVLVNRSRGDFTDRFIIKDLEE